MLGELCQEENIREELDLEMDDEGLIWEAEEGPLQFASWMIKLAVLTKTLHFVQRVCGSE